MTNEKKILIYGLDQDEKKKLSKSNVQLVEIDDTMVDMKISDIISEKKEPVEADETFKGEKIIIFNAIPDIQVRMIIDLTKRVIKKKPILAVVTETSVEWSFKELAEHLIEEREWHKSQKKGNFVHEQK
ncbi:MAG: DUF3783 domain-containing protein [Sarcina sp.]